MAKWREEAEIITDNATAIAEPKWRREAIPVTEPKWRQEAIPLSKPKVGALDAIDTGFVGPRYERRPSGTEIIEQTAFPAIQPDILKKAQGLKAGTVTPPVEPTQTVRMGQKPKPTPFIPPFGGAQLQPIAKQGAALAEKAGLPQVPAETVKALAAGGERLLGVPGALTQYAGESMQEPMKKQVALGAPGMRLIQFIADKKGWAGPSKVYDAVSKKLTKTGKYIADWWDEQASKGWEAPSAELMEAKWKRPLQYGARVTAESAPTFLAAIGASYLTGSPNLGLVILGGVEKLGSYRTQREKGAGFQKADIISNLFGTWEAVTEKIPFDFLIKGPVKSKLLKMAGGGTLEGLQEVLAGMGQNFLQYFGYNAKDWKSVPSAIKEGMQHTFDNWLESFVAGATLGAGAGAAIPGRPVESTKPPVMPAVPEAKPPQVASPAVAVSVVPTAVPTAQPVEKPPVAPPEARPPETGAVQPPATTEEMAQAIGSEIHDRILDKYSDDPTEILKGKTPLGLNVDAETFAEDIGNVVEDVFSVWAQKGEEVGRGYLAEKMRRLEVVKGYILPDKLATDLGFGIAQMMTEGIPKQPLQLPPVQPPAATEQAGKAPLEMTLYRGAPEVEGGANVVATDSGYYGEGRYFSESETTAQAYAKKIGERGQVKKETVRLERPFIIDWTSEDTARKTKDLAKEVGVELNAWGSAVDSHRFTEQLQRSGYDGVVVKKQGEPIEVVQFVVPPAPAQPQGEAQKQPWEMTREEYLASRQKGPKVREDYARAWVPVQGPRQTPNAITFTPYSDGKGGVLQWNDQQGIGQGIVAFDNGKITDLAVNKKYRGQGIAQQLLDEARRRGASGMKEGAEATSVGLRVLHRNEVKQALSEGRPIPRAVLEEYKSEPWAQEALKKGEGTAEEKPETKPYKIGKKTTVQKRYFGNPTTYEWPGNEVVLRDYPQEKITVYETKSGWIIGYENGGAFGKEREGGGWKGFDTKKEAIEVYLRQEHPPVVTPPKGEEKPKTQEGLGGPLKELGGMPREAPGLTKAEVEHLGKREAKALRAGQERGLPIGYKVGERAAFDKAKTVIFEMKAAEKLSEDNQKAALELVETYIPKELRGAYTKAILKADTKKKIERIAQRIEKHVKRLDKRRAMKELRDFIAKAKSSYRRGEQQFGNLPEKVRNEFIGFLDHYDLSKLSEEKAERLSSRNEYINRLANDIASKLEDLDFDPEFDEDVGNIFKMTNPRVQEVRRLSKKHFGQLDTDEIDSIREHLEHLISVNNLKNSIQERMRAEHLRDDINKVEKEEVRKAKTPGDISEIFPGVKSIVAASQAQLDTLVSFVTGKNNDVMMRLLLDNPEKGQAKSWAKKKEILEYAQKRFEEIGFGKKEYDGLFDLVEVNLDGTPRKIPIRQLASLYAHTQAEGNLDRLLKTNGININHHSRNLSTGLLDRFRTQRTSRAPTITEIKEALNKLPDIYKKWIDVCMEINLKKIGPAIDEVGMRMFGHPISHKGKYWSFPREHDIPIGGDVWDISQAIENKGRFQPRTGGNDRLSLVPADIEFISNLEDASALYGMAEPLRDARTLLSNKKFRATMKNNGHSRILRLMDKLFRRIQGIATDQSVLEMKGSKILSLYGKSRLSLRISGGLVQLTSPPASFGVIDPKYFIGIRPPVPGELKRHINRITEEDPVLWHRWKARAFDFVIGDLAARHAFENLFFGKIPISDRLLDHYTKGDEVAVGWTLWKAAKKQIEATTKFKRNTPEFKEAHQDLFHKAMRAQGQADMLHRSDMTSTQNVFLRGSMLFMTTMNSFYNANMKAMSDWRTGRKTLAEASKVWGGTATSLMMGTLVRRAFKYGMYGLGLTLLAALGVEPEKRKYLADILRKEGESEIKRLPQRMVLDLLGMVAFGNVIGQMTDRAIRKFKGQYTSTRLSDIWTGNIFVDISLQMADMVELSAQAAAEFQNRDNKEGRYQSGPRKGKLKWPQTIAKLSDLTTDLLSGFLGAAYSGVKSDIYYPVEKAKKQLNEYMTDDELRREISKTRKQDGGVKKGYEEKNRQLKDELDRRKKK